MNINNIESASFLLKEIKDCKKQIRLLEEMSEFPEICRIELAAPTAINSPVAVLGNEVKSELIAIITKQKKFCEQRIEDLKKRIEEL